MVTKYNDLQQKYTSLSIAYETLANQKVPQTNGTGSSYMSMPLDWWNFTDSGASLASGKDMKKEEERSGLWPGYLHNR
jgi:hypothetical protein